MLTRHVDPPLGPMLLNVTNVLIAIAIPALLFALNWAMRAHRGYAVSAAPDFVLAVATFDFTAVVAHDVFEKVVRSTEVRDAFLNIFAIFFCLCLIFWMSLLLPWEDK